MTSYTFRMPAGIPGDINRIWAANVEPASITPAGTTGAPTAYGVPMVIDATVGNVGNMRTMVAADAFNVNLSPYGILARPFPTGGSQDPLGTSTPPAQGACDILRSGYISVLLSGTTPATKGGPVFIWTAAASGSHIVGGWEAASPGGNGIALLNAYFMGPADASGNVEIAFRT